ncbi:hypothetical protein ACKVEX_14170 [Rhodocyclaceae bacterium SMB388]
MKTLKTGTPVTDPAIIERHLQQRLAELRRTTKADPFSAKLLALPEVVDVLREEIRAQLAKGEVDVSESEVGLAGTSTSAKEAGRKLQAAIAGV